MKTLCRFACDIQNCLFDSMGRYVWNWEKVTALLYTRESEVHRRAFESGRELGRREMAEEVGRKMTSPFSQNVL